MRSKRKTQSSISSPNNNWEKLRWVKDWHYKFGISQHPWYIFNGPH